MRSKSMDIIHEEHRALAAMLSGMGTLVKTAPGVEAQAPAKRTIQKIFFMTDSRVSQRVLVSPAGIDGDTVAAKHPELEEAPLSSVSVTDPPAFSTFAIALLDAIAQVKRIFLVRLPDPRHSLHPLPLHSTHGTSSSTTSKPRPRSLHLPGRQLLQISPAAMAQAIRSLGIGSD